MHTPMFSYIHTYTHTVYDVYISMFAHTYTYTPCDVFDVIHTSMCTHKNDVFR